ncbi:hypothetical protein [Desulfobacula toluolica]|uniref:Conserved uncharacterized protein n=1 Tax=Desulfobacula toluolica (strain DSM 7467 / Tol2) TaxID=651182 RepID=K0NHB2_DESTT|nr:hypothetical protein [Desulfobacula toluolica]CCK80646.1 conserved uncharacterized protein [Desulfobacula toluolica Tol2]
MKLEKKEILTIQKLAQNLATFAIDRTDLKELLAAIPENSRSNLTAIEYELQLLKILSVGWAISFFMPGNDKNKGPLTELFWGYIREISGNISTLTQTTTSQSIDYFEILKTRLNTYLKMMQDNPEEAQNPVNIMGPAFANACKCDNDPIAILTGTKMFTLTLGAVKEYLNAVKIDDIKLN